MFKKQDELYREQVKLLIEAIQQSKRHRIFLRDDQKGDALAIHYEDCMDGGDPYVIELYSYNDDIDTTLNWTITVDREHNPIRFGMGTREQQQDEIEQGYIDYFPEETGICVLAPYIQRLEQLRKAGLPL